MISRLTSLRLDRHSTMSRILALTTVLILFSLASFGQYKTDSLPAEFMVIDGATLPASPEHLVAMTSPKVPRSPAHGVIPASALPMISAALGANDAGYGIRADGRTLGARNSRQGLTAVFSSDGVVLASGNASLRMKLTGYGSGHATMPIHDVRPIARDNRIEYRRGPLTEWYVNGPAGSRAGLHFAGSAQTATRRTTPDRTLLFRRVAAGTREQWRGAGLEAP